MSTADLDTLQRFLAQFAEDDNGCWIWQGKPSAQGYGRFTVAYRTDYIHRLAHEIFIGPIPHGLTIDHLCRVRMCGNPDHLEAVDLGTNILRGNAPSAIAARRDHCVRGHPYDEANTYITSDGARVCRACHRSHRMRYHYAKKGVRH